jgi:hypothetical protein
MMGSTLMVHTVVLFGAYLIVSPSDGWVLAYRYIEKIRESLQLQLVNPANKTP